MSNVEGLRQMREREYRAMQVRAKQVAELSAVEVVRLQALEEVVERGLATFVAVGAALAEIREKRLYRAQYPEFDDYVRERWGISETRATRLISARAVVENLKTMPIGIGVLPVTEAQARELAHLPPEEQGPAWQRAVDAATEAGKPVTAKRVREAVRPEVGTKPRAEKCPYCKGTGRV